MSETLLGVEMDPAEALEAENLVRDREPNPGDAEAILEIDREAKIDLLIRFGHSKFGTEESRSRALLLVRLIQKLHN